MKKQTIMEAINLPLYQRIARQLKSAIERGELTPGSRLPASRVYAQEQGVSRATIENAWGELVAQDGSSGVGRRGPLSASGSARASWRRYRQCNRPRRRSRCRFRWGCRRWISFRAGSGRG